MIGGSFLQVLLRNFFHTGLEGADVLFRHGVLWIALVGASLATRRARHIRIDLVPRLIPSGCRVWVERITAIAALAVAGILTWAGWTLVALEQEAKTALALGVPTWAAQAILPLEFLIITFRLGLLAAGEPLEAAADKEGSS